MHFVLKSTSQKGPEFFLDIASKVIAENDNVRFVMAGNGDQLKRIIETGAYRNVGNKFHFTGFLDREKVNKLLAMSDVYCMPSVSEPFGLSAVEAAQFGIPAVISKQSGAAEVMEHALKADFWDVDLMAKHINDLLTNDEIKNRVIEGTYKDIERVTWDQSAFGILKAYEAVLGRPIELDENPLSAKTSKKVDEVMASVATDSHMGEMSNIPKDDLTKIEGIDFDVELVLNRAGILTWEDVINTRTSILKGLVENTIPSARHISSWQQQAELASKGNWEQLEELQGKL
jgi:predicted flap endonuclease-1-like 5' DNA nuclease